MWISPKFAVKVSYWIEDWRSYSKENNDQYVYNISNLEASLSIQKEKLIQNILQTRLSGEIEVETPFGFIDIMTNDTIIEIKCFKHWKDAIGQILAYGNYFPDKKKSIYLFDIPKNTDMGYINSIKTLLEQYEIELLLNEN